MYKIFSQIRRKTIHRKSQVKDITKEEILVANKCMKRYSTSLLIGKYRFKNSPFSTHDVGKDLKKWKIVTVGKGVRKDTPLYTVGRFIFFGSQFGQISYLGLNHVVGASDQFNI